MNRVRRIEEEEEAVLRGASLIRSVEARNLTHSSVLSLQAHILVVSQIRKTAPVFARAKARSSLSGL